MNVTPNYMGMILVIVITFFASGPSTAARRPLLRPYVDGQVLVKFKGNQVFERSVHYRSMWGISHVRTFKKSGVIKIQLPSDMTVDQAIALYGNDPAVIYAEPNYRYRLQAVPDDTYMNRLWGLINVGQDVNGSVGSPDADMDGDQAWDLVTGSKDIVVAVVDTGVDATHPDLTANIWTNLGEVPDNGVDDDSNGYVDDVNGWDFIENDNRPIDSHGHGTHVAGIIGAVGNNQTGVAGVCWRVSIMPLRFISTADYGTTAEAIEAIEYAADNGANVINLSWGGPGFSQALKDAIDAVDALVVCAAGNESTNLDIAPLYPASYGSANILSAGASDADDYPTWFTNYSDRLVDVVAPGTNIISTVPDRQTLFMEDFSNLSNWHFGGDGNAWDVETIDDNQALAESPSGNYTNSMNTWAQLVPLSLFGRSAVRLDFDIIGTTAGSEDHLVVEASTDGSIWSQLWVGLEDEGPVTSITGNLNTWQSAVVDLKAYDGAPSLSIRFRFISDDAGVSDGYLIDDVVITSADTTHGSNAYQYYQGTSMSTAYVSGAAALVMSQKQWLTPTEVRLTIESSVDQKVQLAGTIATSGRVNLYNALISMATVDLRSSASAADQINLEWTVLDPGYSDIEIQRRDASGSDYTTIAIVGRNDPGYADGGLSDNTTYIYRVLTLIHGSLNGYSNETTSTTPPRAVAVETSVSGGGGGGGCFISNAWNGLHRMMINKNRVAPQH